MWFDFCGFCFVPFILFSVSISDQTVLMTTALYYVLRSGIVILPGWFLIFRLLWLCMVSCFSKWTFLFSVSEKSVLGFWFFKPYMDPIKSRFCKYKAVCLVSPGEKTAALYEYLVSLWMWFWVVNWVAWIIWFLIAKENPNHCSSCLLFLLLSPENLFYFGFGLTSRRWDRPEANLVSITIQHFHYASFWC